MSEGGKNNIAGRWCNRHTSVENINPSNIGYVIGHDAHPDCVQLFSALDGFEKAQKKWSVTSLEAPKRTSMIIGKEPLERQVELGNLATACTKCHLQFYGRGNSSYGPREKVGYVEVFYTIVKNSHIADNNPEWHNAPD